MITLYLGVDIAKRTLDAAVWGATGGTWLGTFANDTDGFEQLAIQVDRQRIEQQATQVRLVLEPTGGYELGLVVYGLGQEWQISLPNPKTVRQWGKATGRRAKTDRQDALLLAHYGAECQPPVRHLLPAVVEELDNLLERREDLKKLLRSERNRLEALRQRPPGPYRPRAVVESLERVIDQLTQEEAAIAEAIKGLLNESPELRDKVKRLLTIPGVGPVVSLPLLVLLYRWDTITQGQGGAKSLTAFVGLDPVLRQSGQMVFGRATISRTGDPSLRAVLYMGALGGVRGQNPLRHFYTQMVARGKAKRLALVAASRKILVWAWAIFRSNQSFDPTRFAHLDAALLT